MADITKDRVKDGIDSGAAWAKSGVDAVSGVANEAKHEGHSLADRAGEMATQAGEKAREWAGDACETMHRAGETAEKWAGEVKDTATKAVGDFGQEVTDLIRKHPLPALLVGFGIGMLLGRTMRAI